MSEISFKTDPQNEDYAVETGAYRTFQAGRLAELEEERLQQEKEEEEANNPMLALENRTKESRREMDVIDALEEIRDWNARNAQGVCGLEALHFVIIVVANSPSSVIVSPCLVFFLSTCLVYLVSFPPSPLPLSLLPSLPPTFPTSHPLFPLPPPSFPPSFLFPTPLIHPSFPSLSSSPIPLLSLSIVKFDDLMERHLESEKKEDAELKEREDQLIKKAFDKRRADIKRIRDDLDDSDQGDLDDGSEELAKKRKVDSLTSIKPPSSKKTLLGMVKRPAVIGKGASASAGGEDGGDKDLEVEPAASHPLGLLCAYSDSDSSDASGEEEHG